MHQIDPRPFDYSYEYVHKYHLRPTAEISEIRMSWLKRHLGKLPKSVLDFGAGTGAFLKSYQEIDGATTFAFDIVDYPLPDGVLRVTDPTDSYFGLITFYDSLEHLESLSVLAEIKCKYLCISLPWCHYLSDEWLRNWKHLKPNEHIWHFSLDGLTRTCRQHGFSLIAFGSPEDQIRKPSGHLPNILSALFVK